MPISPNCYSVSGVFYWPTRASIAEAEFQYPNKGIDGKLISVKIEYKPILEIRGEKFSSLNWTKFSVTFDLNNQKDEAGFVDWLKTDNGKAKCLDTLIKIQNSIIDNIKYNFQYNEFHQNIRHFGPAEWPYHSIVFKENLIIEELNPAIMTDILLPKLSPAYTELKESTSISPTVRFLLRAVDLVESSYTTEAILLAVSIFDDTLQKALIFGMKKIGVSEDAATAQLRNITQSRFVTYLDPIMKLITNVSLNDENPKLFSSVESMNRKRNDAIHNGRETTRTDAKDILLTIWDTLDFIARHTGFKIDLPKKPIFKDF